MRPRRKRRTSPMDVPFGSSGPRTNDGLTITTESPCAASRRASTSASCLELTYAMPSSPARNGLVLIRGAPRLGWADRGDRGCVHDPPDARRQRLLEDDPRPLDVEFEDPVAILRAHRGRAGQMEHALDVLHRGAHRGSVQHVSARALEFEVGEVVYVRPAAQHQAQIVAARRKRPDQMGTQEAAAAGDECLGHWQVILVSNRSPSGSKGGSPSSSDRPPRSYPSSRDPALDPVALSRKRG